LWNPGNIIVGPEVNKRAKKYQSELDLEAITYLNKNNSVHGFNIRALNEVIQG
jgi:hypothetical protein